MPETTNQSDTITIRAVCHGEDTFEVNRAEYEAAKADDTLDHLLDTKLSRIETDVVLYEPDGTEVHPY